MKIKLLAAALACLALSGCNKQEASKEEKKPEHLHTTPTYQKEGTGRHSSLESEGNMAQDAQGMMLAGEQPESNTQSQASDPSLPNQNQNSNQNPHDVHNDLPIKPQDPVPAGSELGAPGAQQPGSNSLAAPFEDEDE